MCRCDNVGGLGEHVKKHVLWFLRYTLKKFFCFILRLTPSPHTWTDFDNLYTSYDVFPPKDVTFGVSFILLPILGVKSPKKPYLGGVNRHFQA